MARSNQSSNVEREQIIARGLRRLVARPDWLVDALDPERVRQSLARYIPEVAAGALRLTDCAIERLFLKNTQGRWFGTCEVTVEGLPGEQRQVIPLHVTLTAPGLPLPEGAEQPATRPFGAEDWRCYLPDLRLACELEPPEQALETLPQLTDPEQARAMLERAINAGTSTYRGMRIQACRPQVLNYKPGSRCTILYHLEYSAEDAGRGWPATVIVKTYREHKGERAFKGMAALWHTPLAAGDIVRIAEPLAYVPELRILIQAPLAEEQTLEALLRSTLLAGTPEAHERLEHFIRTAASGLAALHLSGAYAPETVTWADRIIEIPELIERLVVVAPDLADPMNALLDHLHAHAAAHPADPPVPSHGSFDSDQVLVAGDQISFIDFDNFRMAEPALDVAHFRAAIMDSGMKLIDEPTLRSPQARQAYLQRLDALGAIFLEQYESSAPVSRQRLALWEALDYLRDTIHLWTKAKPMGAEAVMRILEYHLRAMEILT